MHYFTPYTVILILTERTAHQSNGASSSKIGNSRTIFSGRSRKHRDTRAINQKQQLGKRRSTPTSIRGASERISSIGRSRQRGSAPHKYAAGTQESIWREALARRSDSWEGDLYVGATDSALPANPSEYLCFAPPISWDFSRWRICALELGFWASSGCYRFVRWGDGIYWNVDDCKFWWLYNICVLLNFLHSRTKCNKILFDTYF